MIKTKILAMSFAGALAVVPAPAALADSAKGQKVFAKCKACHEVATEKAKVGPSLKGVFGRTAGTVEGFAYSDAMKASGIVWSEETLKTYAADPKAMVPGTKMAFAGIKKAEDIDDLVDYLEEATK